MAVYERTYRPYEGFLTAERWRFLILPRYAYEQVSRSRIFVAYFLLSFAPALAGAILIYLHHNLTALAMLRLEVANLVAIDQTFFLAILTAEGWLASLLALFIGPALISPDLANNALPLYLCRPFSRREYILGKFCVLAILMSAITWVPCLLLFAFQSYLEGFDWFVGNLSIASSIVLASGIWILVLSLMTMAASAWVRRKPVAAGLVLAYFFVSKGMGAAIDEMYTTWVGGLIDVGGLVTTVWADLFDVPIGARALPQWTCWLALVLFCAGCLLLLTRKIRAYSVVKG